MLLAEGHNLLQWGNLLNGHNVLGVPLPTLTINSYPTLNASVMKVGATLDACKVAGSYSWPGGPLIETWVWFVDGVSQLGTYVISPGDVNIEADVFLTGSGYSGPSIHVGPTTVTNTAPVAVGGAFKFIVPASGPAPQFFTTATATPYTYFKDTVAWPTTGGKITIAIDFLLTALGTTRYLYEMDNGHISLQVLSDGRLFLSIKDSASAAVITSVVIGTITAGTRYDIIVAVDLAALTAWTTINGVTTSRTLGANTGILASASRRLCLLARAAGNLNNLLGSIYKMEVWQDCVTGGGRPSTDTNLRTNGRILPPAASANVHPWKNGNDVT